MKNTEAFSWHGNCSHHSVFAKPDSMFAAKTVEYSNEKRMGEWDEVANLEEKKEYIHLWLQVVDNRSHLSNITAGMVSLFLRLQHTRKVINNVAF